MAHSVSSSVPTRTSVHLSNSVTCSIAEHPILHEFVDYIEDASKTTYDFVKSLFKSDTSISVDCTQ
ncbi:hypothetical protein BD410DRAFT_783350 [Rickenella mellea]|uniref:Uncharacterized protein n=1 Tax=Rickenella mellea TaxID=50990 RepID=A0A4Y7QHN6_9AGAM|nr:hypothetical protein BD410DRAFT_783350 [Rickenella mellea]